MILDGKKVRNELLEQYKKTIIDNNLDLTLAIIFIGDNSASQIYVNNKIKYCTYVGIKTKLIKLNDDVSEREVLEIIEDLNKDANIDGIILQSPVPKHINFEKCIVKINPAKDIDGFTKENFFALAHNQSGLFPCTAEGIIKLLDYYHIDLLGKNVCLIGRGNLVGKPLIFEFLNRNATVSICHSKTQNIQDYTQMADIIVCGVGKAHLLTRDMIKDGAIVIDAGISFIDSKQVGDADYENIYDKCSYITPNPGGVGPMTIAAIIENMLKIKARKEK